jgi:hypothetical protein
MENKLYRKIIGFITFVLLSSSSIVAQENKNINENWFLRHFEQRIYLGFYDSFGDEKTNVLQAGYDAVLNLIEITPSWYLFDFCLGLDALFVRDQINTKSSSWYGEPRTTENRLIPAFELNWGVRLHFLPITKIKTTLYLEAVPITLFIYTQPYPDSGTYVNIGTHFGFGFKSKINDVLNIYATLRIFSHTSNGQPEESNPSLDMVGLIVGLQF